MKNPIVDGHKVGDVWLHSPDGKPRIWSDHGLVEADGRWLFVKDFPKLYSVIRGAFGEIKETGQFQLPDYRSIVAL